jgi:hypothetical protein
MSAKTIAKETERVIMKLGGENMNPLPNASKAVIPIEELTERSVERQGALFISGLAEERRLAGIGRRQY